MWGASPSVPHSRPQGNQPNMTPPSEAPSKTGELWAPSPGDVGSLSAGAWPTEASVCLEGFEGALDAGVILVLDLGASYSGVYTSGENSPR